MSFLLSGVHVPHRKNTASLAAKRPQPPKSVVIPMSMHIGKPATPVVKVGDHVDVGTLIAEQNGFISSPIYASVSGTVKKIDSILLSNGSFGTAITIESDGLMTKSADIKIPNVENYDDFIAAVKNSGIVGLGGAGFPTYVKLDVKDTSRIEELIINGAECEPYITSDTRTMIDDADSIADAIALFKKYLGVKKIIIGIENNKKEAIEKMRELSEKDADIEVRVLPSLYPQGGEKVLIYHTTGKTVPAGKLPLDVGCVVCNCTTMSAISKYIRTGMPLTEKCVTVDGSAVKEPQNLIVPIGTPVSYLFEQCGGFIKEPKKVIYGGPMMGITVPNLDAPVLKNTNAVIAFAEKEAKKPAPTQCIHCGACATHCPVRLSPLSIARAYKLSDGEALKKLRVDICMECGCCAYVCPAKRPLVETNKLSKTLLREYLAKEKEAEKK